MKRKISLLLLAVTLVAGMAGCAGSKHCKECDDEVYEEGYCKYHYEINVVKNKVDELGKEIYDIFNSDEE